MSGNESAVIDASALLAYIYEEPGGDQLPRLAGDLPVMSAVNWSEVVQKTLNTGIEPDRLRAACEETGLELRPFTIEQAEQAAELWQHTRWLGLSLGDRACLAVAILAGVPALTADRTWSQVSVAGLRVEVVHR